MRSCGHLAAAACVSSVTGGPAPEERAYLDALLDVSTGALRAVDGRLVAAQTADVLRHAVLYCRPDTATPTRAAVRHADHRDLRSDRSPIWGPWPAHDGEAYHAGRDASAPRQRAAAAEPELTCVPCRWKAANGIAAAILSASIACPRRA